MGNGAGIARCRKSLGRGPDDPGFDSWMSTRICVQQKVQTSSGADRTSYSTGNMGSFPGHKGLLSEANHSPPSTAKVQNEWS
jgi:hypothetical protein